MITRRTFIAWLAALLYGCGGGGSGGGGGSDPAPKPPATEPPVDSYPPAFGSLTTEYGYYVLRDANSTVRVKAHIDSLIGSHVVEDDKVTVYHGDGSTTVIGVL